MDETIHGLTGLEAKLVALVRPTIAHMGYDLVRVAVLGGAGGRGKPTVQIMADRADGGPITVEDCEALTWQVGTLLDVEDPMPSAWTLEISSSGIDRPLTRTKDWIRFAGHLAKAETHEMIEGRKRFSGVVLGADEAAGRLRLDDGTEVALPFDQLRRARLVLTDALIAATATPRQEH